MTKHLNYIFIRLLLILPIASLLTFSGWASALTLQAEVNQTTIARSETLNLIVTADDNANQDIDFSQLAFQFDILNTQRSSRVTINNGKRAAKTFWVITLAPKEVGKLTIPSFKYKNAFSPSITINVTKEANAARSRSGGNPDIFFEVITDKKQAYVQEQIVVSARLYYKISLANYEHEDFKVDNTRIEQLHKKDDTTIFRGEAYKVLEERYTLHPQSSGKVTIPTQTWRLEKPSRRFGFGNSTNPYLYIRSKPLTIDVLPIPSNRSANTDWLPSKKVELAAQWKQSPLQASIGEPLNLQISINAQGLFDYQLPDLALNQTDDFTIYQAQPETNNIKDITGVTGIRKINYSIIPRKTGQFTLPDISLTWWNTDTNKEEVFQLAKQNIIVAKSTIASNNVINNQAILEPITTVSPTTHKTSTPLLVWQLVAGFFAIIICFLCYQLYRFKGIQTVSTGKTNSNLQWFASQEKIHLNNINNAIDAQNWQLLRREIINWGKLTLNDTHVDSLNKISIRFPELALPLQQLENKLYGQRTDDSYNPQQLFKLIKKQKPATHKQTKIQLKELY